MPGKMRTSSLAMGSTTVHFILPLERVPRYWIKKMCIYCENRLLFEYTYKIKCVVCDSCNKCMIDYAQMHKYNYGYIL